MLAATTWPDVGLALVGVIPGLAAAFFAYRATILGRHLKDEITTPSRTSIGKQVESAHHVALANNYRLQALGADVGVASSDKAVKAETFVHPPNGD